MRIPIVLPEGWTAEEPTSYGIVINAADGMGSVTVSEKMHGFSLGVTPVRRKGNFDGRKWKVALYDAAVEALKATIV